MHTVTARLPYSDALPIYRGLQGKGPTCLFESASAVDKSSRLSVIGLEPSLELIGKGEHLDIRLLDERGRLFMEAVQQKFADFIERQETSRLLLHIPKTPFLGAEEDRLERQNIVQPLRFLLAKFKTDDKNFMGFYGALAYQFVYQFEDLKYQKSCPEPDFHLFLFDNLLLFNHLTQDLTLYVTREAETAAQSALAQIKDQLHRPAVAAGTPLRVGKFVQSPDDDTFKKQVERGIQLCYEGE
jgi:anthranilate/para-aminobenzoate synthase component I